MIYIFNMNYVQGVKEHIMYHKYNRFVLFVNHSFIETLISSFQYSAILKLNWDF